jgi:sugar phosphate isomerase/epimerase
MTQLGFCSISALDRPLADAARLAADCGLDGLEVTGRAPHLEDDTSLEAVRDAGRAVRDAGLEVLAYGSYLGHGAARDEAAMQREVSRAAALGAPLLRVWAEVDLEAADRGFAAQVKLLQATCDAAREHGIGVVVERHVGSFADTAERVERLFEAVARDALALNYQVLDFLPAERVAAQPDDARRLVPLARYLHLKNYQPNPQAGGPLAPGGSLEGGVLDYQALLGAVFEAGYDGPMTIEFVSWEPRPLEEKLAADVAYLRALLSQLGRG